MIINTLSKQAIDELDINVNVNESENKIKIYPDLRVKGTYAVKVYRKSDDQTFDLLRNKWI